MNELEQKGVVSICILAAFADGAQSESEREKVQRISEGFHQNPMLAAIYQEVLGQKVTVAQAVQGVQSPEARALAYEMAVCVCNADGVTSEDEQRFLQDLRNQLQLDPASSDRVKAQVEQVAQTPPGQMPPRIPVAAEQDIDEMIVNCAMLTGALELLPPSIATMAIIPIQTRLVYRIGERHGFELSRVHIQDFLATVGVGLTSQVVEGFARKLVGGLARPIAGRLAGGVAETVVGSAFSFGTTYALGQVAKQYYSAGRTLDAARLRQLFGSLLEEGNALRERYANQIVEKSRQLNVSDLLPLVTRH